MQQNYPVFSNWNWYTYDSKQPINLQEFVEGNIGRQFYIGTDSHNKGDKCRYTTVCIAYEEGEGGSVIFHSDHTPRPPNLRQKLLNETMRTVELAWYLEELVGDNEFFEFHMDVNPNKKFGSGKYHAELVGMVKGMNYKAVSKPKSWAATHAADKKTK